MASDISLLEGEAQAAVVIRTRTTIAGLPGALGDIFPEVLAYVYAQGREPAGPPFARYHDYGPQGVELEGGFPLAHGLAGTGRVIGVELPGGRLVRTTWSGAKEHPEDAYAAVREFLAAHGLESAGSPWEVYGNVSEDILDSDIWVTELFWPVKGNVGR